MATSTRCESRRRSECSRQALSSSASAGWEAYRLRPIARAERGSRRRSQAPALWSASRNDSFRNRRRSHQFSSVREVTIPTPTKQAAQMPAPGLESSAFTEKEIGAGVQVRNDTLLYFPASVRRQV